MTTRKTREEWLQEGRARKAARLTGVLIDREVHWTAVVDMSDDDWRKVAAEATIVHGETVRPPSQATVDRVVRLMVARQGTEGMRR